MGCLHDHVSARLTGSNSRHRCLIAKHTCTQPSPRRGWANSPAVCARVCQCAHSICWTRQVQPVEVEAGEPAAREVLKREKKKKHKKHKVICLVAHCSWSILRLRAHKWYQCGYKSYWGTGDIPWAHSQQEAALVMLAPSHDLQVHWPRVGCTQETQASRQRSGSGAIDTAGKN